MSLREERGFSGYELNDAAGKWLFEQYGFRNK